MYRKIAIIVIVMVLMFSLVSLPTAYADTISNAGGSDTLSEEEYQQIKEMEEFAEKQPLMEKLFKQEEKAVALYYLGLFKGSNNSFELERAPTRTEAIVLLLRMLGKEQEAKDSNYTHPFTDVPSWADKYIAYGYNKGLASGYSSTTFGGSDNATPEQFCALTLRALQYNEKDGDFVYKESIKKAEELGLAAAGKYVVGSKSFTRGDCVDIIYKALAVVKKTEGVTLAESLVKSGFIDGAKAESYGLYSEYEKIRVPLRKDPKTGEMTLFLADVIKMVPGAKYGSLFYGGGITSLTDYEKAFDQELYSIYESLINPSKSADLLNGLTNVSIVPSTFDGPGGAKTLLFCAIYDGNTNVLAESISKWQEVADNKYMEFALVNISLKSLVDARDTKFNKLFGNPVEAPNAITTIEKAKIHWITIDNNTGKTKEEGINSGYSYRYVFNKEAYPELAEQIKGFSEFAIPAGTSVNPAGMSTRDVIIQEWRFRMGLADFKGSFTGVYSLANYETYQNDWTQHASDWNNPRYVVFDDGNKPIAYAKIYPSQFKVVDVGQVKAEIYVGPETKTGNIVKRVYTKE